MLKVYRISKELYDMAVGNEEERRRCMPSTLQTAGVNLGFENILHLPEAAEQSKPILNMNFSA